MIGSVILFSLQYCFSQFVNFRLHPSGNQQIEPTITKHPANPLIMFASAFTITYSFHSESVYVSTDGGSTWRGTDTCPGAPINNHGGDPGPVIDKDGRLILTHQGGFVLGMYANYSTNYGISWSNNYQIAANDQDKGSPGTDDAPLSPYYGRTYLVWTKYTIPYPIAISFTTNGGQSWVQPSYINNNYGHVSQGPSVCVNSTGKTFVTWAASIQNSPFTEDYIGFAVSDNGGVNWTVTENAYDCNGIKTSSLEPWNIRVNSYPSIDIDKSGTIRNNWIYIVTSEKNLAPAGSDPDIIIHHSSNNGITWSQGRRVNQDLLNNGKKQFFPAINIDAEGGVNVVYYDNRNIQSDSLEVFISRSTDGGFMWHDYLVSDHRYKPKAIAGSGGGNQGDNIGITSTNGKLFPVWMDDHTGIYQIWSAAIDYSSIGIRRVGEKIPQRFFLGQNYPNPFNPSTKIKFEIPGKNNGKSSPDRVTLKIYSSIGSEISTLVDKNLPAGFYEAEWEPVNMPGGVYFIKFESGNEILSGKMIYLK